MYRLELCFWLFLITVGPKHTSWFRSLHFKIWAVGSLIAIVGMPLVTIFTRHDPLKVSILTTLFVIELNLMLFSVRHGLILPVVLVASSSLFGHYGFCECVANLSRN